MDEPNKTKWELVEAENGRFATVRLPVDGGWIYRYGGEAMCFVPAPVPPREGGRS